MPYAMTPHTADLALKLWAKDMTELLINGAEGVVSLMTDVERIGNSTSEAIELPYDNEADLLVDLMNDILFRFETRQVLLPWLQIDSFENGRMRGILMGETWDPVRFSILRVPKIVTHHHLEIQHTTKGVETTVVIDC